jgi:hypothetical protein
MASSLVNCLYKCAHLPAEPSPVPFPDPFSLISSPFLRFFGLQNGLTPMFPLHTTIPPVSPLFPLDTKNRGVPPPLWHDHPFHFGTLPRPIFVRPFLLRRSPPRCALCGETSSPLSFVSSSSRRSPLLCPPCYKSFIFLDPPAFTTHSYSRHIGVTTNFHSLVTMFAIPNGLRGASAGPCLSQTAALR